MKTPVTTLDTINKRIAYIQYLKAINLYTGKKLMQFMRLFNRLQTLRMQEQGKQQQYHIQDRAAMLFYNT